MKAKERKTLINVCASLEVAWKKFTSDDQGDWGSAMEHLRAARIDVAGLLKAKETSTGAKQEG